MWLLLLVAACSAEVFNCVEYPGYHKIYELGECYWESDESTVMYTKFNETHYTMAYFTNTHCEGTPENNSTNPLTDDDSNTDCQFGGIPETYVNYTHYSTNNCSDEGMRRPNYIVEFGCFNLTMDYNNSYRFSVNKDRSKLVIDMFPRVTDCAKDVFDPQERLLNHCYPNEPTSFQFTYVNPNEDPSSTKPAGDSSNGVVPIAMLLVAAVLLVVL